jgi:hypothetical protein
MRLGTLGHDGAEPNEDRIIVRLNTHVATDELVEFAVIQQVRIGGATSSTTYRFVVTDPEQGDSGARAQLVAVAGEYAGVRLTITARR